MLRTLVVISTLFLCCPAFLLINPKWANDHFGVYGIEKHPMTVVYEQEITKKSPIDEKKATYKLCASSQIYIFASRRYCK